MDKQTNHLRKSRTIPMMYILVLLCAAVTVTSMAYSYKTAEKIVTIHSSLAGADNVETHLQQEVGLEWRNFQATQISLIILCISFAAVTAVFFNYLIRRSHRRMLRLAASEQQLKAANQQLVQQEKYYRTLLFSLHEDILVIDRDYRIVDVNSMALNTLGAEREDVLGRHCYEVSHGLSTPCHEHGEKCGLRTVFDTGEHCNLRHEHSQTSGKTVHIDLIMSPLKDEDGNITHVIEAARDVTNLFQVEAELRVANRQLAADEQQLRAANQQLAADEQQLRAANQQLAADEQQLRAANQQLAADEQQLRAANQQLAADEKQLRKVNYDMGERVKEINCLYGLARLDEKPDTSIEQIIDELVELIPQGWQYPEIAAARITLGTYKTKAKNFRKTKWCQTADINLHGEKAGAIEVCYLEKKPLIDEETFLVQERNLIDGLASRLGHIAERKRAELILRHSEENLAQSQVMANIGSWGWNLKNDRVWWSDQMYRIFGLEPGRPKQPTFKIFLSRIHPDDREMVESTLAGVRKNKQPSGFEFRTVPVNGQVRTLYVHCDVEYDAENNPVRMFGTDIDITERKHTEQERERLYRAVAAKNQELQSIVFIASHDLRSPLVNVKGFAGELERSCQELEKVLEHKAITEPLKGKIDSLLKEDIPESLNFINAGADKMDLLIGGLLRLSRIGTTALEVDKLDMSRMIKNILKTVRFDIQKRNAKVDVGDMPHCFGDASQVNQVFSNLIDNALKYMHPEREAVIQISGQSKDGHSIYCVQDNGMGISDEHMDKIFEIFHRLNPNETDGEGLGLTIVKRILDRQDGRIWVESERGKGSRFYVSLPAS